MANPVRIRLSRAMGFNLQAASRVVNGLPAVNVARPTRWGNPYRIGDQNPYAGEGDDMPIDAEDVVNFYNLAVATGLMLAEGDPLRELRGKNLACWCSGPHCHADILIELANRPDQPIDGAGTQTAEAPKP